MSMTIGRSAQWWLLLTAAVTVLPHLPYIQPWLGAGAVLVLLGQAWRIHVARAAPGWLITTPLAICAGIGVVIGYQTLFGKQAGIALLVVLLSLKLLESRSVRDVRVCIYLAYFLQLGLFFDTESALTALIAVAGVWSATATLITVSGLHQPKRSLKLAGILIAQSMPIMLLLFFLFPRIPGPLWGLPEDAFSARTGLSDTMNPGSIAELIQSSEVAFRARFSGPPPPRAQLYWRGPVLTRFDGRQWTASPLPPGLTPFYEATGPAYAYTMTLEAHDKLWMLALDFPGPDISGARYGQYFELLSDKRVQQRTRFDAMAYPEARVGLDDRRHILNEARRLPPDRNPRTKALALQLRQKADSDTQMVSLALDWMRKAELGYTLSPPPLGRDTADEFLFDTRRGFCEHFTNSFVVLMRASGIPARVVTGYQGGELNPFDGHWIIRQSDAHAWAEVWLPGEGWRRVDPTAESYPARIDDGLASALGREEVLPFMIRPELEWLRTLRYRWDYVNNAWNQWVLGYNQSKQREFLSRFGLDAADWVQLGSALLALTGAIFGTLLWWSHRAAIERDPLQRAWGAMERKLRKAGVPRLPHEGPADYARRAGEQLPAQRDAISVIAQRYAQMRYGRDVPERRDIRHLHSMIDRLKF